MKLQRMVSLVLALVLLFGTAALCVHPAAAASEMTVSEDLIKILKLEEGFIRETKVEGRRRSYILTDKGAATLDAEYQRLCQQAQDYRRFFGKEET